MFSFYESKDDDDEDASIPLLPIDDIREEQLRNKYILRAVEYLTTIVYVFSWTVTFSIFLALLNFLVNNSVPIWVFFFVLWLGHLTIFIIAGASIQLVIDGMWSNKKSNTTSTRQWHQSNEQRIPLVHYLIHHLSWILWITVILIIFEVFLFISYLSIIDASYCLIPIYIVTGWGLLNALVCKYVNILDVIYLLLI